MLSICNIFILRNFLEFDYLWNIEDRELAALVLLVLSNHREKRLAGIAELSHLSTSEKGLEAALLECGVPDLMFEELYNDSLSYLTKEGLVEHDSDYEVIELTEMGCEAALALEDELLFVDDWEPSTIKSDLNLGKIEDRLLIELAKMEGPKVKRVSDGILKEGDGTPFKGNDLAKYLNIDIGEIIAAFDRLAHFGFADPTRHSTAQDSQFELTGIGYQRGRLLDNRSYNAPLLESAIPASDRIVSLSDNQHEVADLRHAVAALDERIQTANDLSYIEPRELRTLRVDVESIRAIVNMKNATYALLGGFVLQTLFKITEKLSDAISSEIATTAISALRAVLGT